VNVPNSCCLACDLCLTLVLDFKRCSSSAMARPSREVCVISLVHFDIEVRGDELKELET
jgi:hypothetical protein